MAYSSLFAKVLILLLHLVHCHCVGIHGALAHFLSFIVRHEVLGAIGPNVEPTAILLAIFPVALEALPVGVVDDPLPAALIILELPLIRLPVRPHVGALTLLLPLHKIAEIEPAVGPLEQPLALHRVIHEWPLVDFAS